MPKRDVLKKGTLAAWRYFGQGDQPDDQVLEVEGEGTRPSRAPVATEPEQASHALRDIHENMDALAEEIFRVSAIGAREEQAAATEDLAARAAQASLELCALREDAAVLLARLVVRHFRSLPAELARHAAFALSWPRLSGGDLADLFCDAAELGDSTLAWSLGSAAGERLGRLSGLGARLARILERSSNLDARRLAAQFLEQGAWPEAVPALRKALREPLLGLREPVLRALLACRGLEAEDVDWLLAEAVDHPPDLDRPNLVDRGFSYERALLRAIRTVPSPRAEGRLIEIGTGEARSPRYGRVALSEHWAYSALAAAYPEASLDFMDRVLGDSHAWRRRRIVDAIAELPDELALERLERAARDPAYDVADHAQCVALSRLKRACQVSPLDGVPLDFLPAPPSEQFHARLLVLRGRSEEARLTMLEVLLADAPDPEALVLLLFALEGDCMQNSGDKRPGLPNSPERWVQALLARFGERAGEGLLRLAERKQDGEWLTALAGSVAALPHGALDRLRRRALELLRSSVHPDWVVAVRAMMKLGAPPEAASRLWALAFHGGSRLLTSAARRALASIADPKVDAELLRELSESLEDRCFDDVEWLLDLGFQRETPGLEERALELIGSPDPELTEHLRLACDHLDQRGRLDEAWLSRALGDPESETFSLAAGLFGGRRKPPDAAQALLFDALSSKARGGRSAAEAAHTLLACDLLRADDERLPPVVAAAPEKERVELIHLLAYEGISYEIYSRWVLPLLRSTDPAVAQRALDCLMFRDRTSAEQLASLYPEVVAKEVRDCIDRTLKRPRRRDDYWLDLAYVYDAEQEEDFTIDDLSP